ncbi:hypothetical protein GCM10011316_21680 [Roseibium aquae]|uniref:KTSC domain-containing protein n=1 Tax=Roseibium aquae TaxID=1323746 RepID=A0A916TKN2_9HYPH|nr:KTSC domain-containing protein [Roseibium aquae]GGB49206.1 hypothetical protein GCM10011316_21680 [Roseibium aquae]
MTDKKKDDDSSMFGIFIFAIIGTGVITGGMEFAAKTGWFKEEEPEPVVRVVNGIGIPEKNPRKWGLHREEVIQLANGSYVDVGSFSEVNFTSSWIEKIYIEEGWIEIEYLGSDMDITCGFDIEEDGSPSCTDRRDRDIDYDINVEEYIPDMDVIFVFPNGAYRYCDVTGYEVYDLVRAESAGKFYNNHIKGRYRCD